VLAGACVVGVACSSDESTSEASRPLTSVTTTSTTTVSTTTVPAPADPTRAALGERLADELGDVNVGRRVATDLEQGTLDRLVTAAGGDLAGSPVLDYEPTTAPLHQIDSIWTFSFGFRIDADAGIAPVGLMDPPPPMDVVSPGPVNAALAQVVADLVEDRPVPVVAQWEIARELVRLGVKDVISVEPEVAPDGSVVYLSTPAVAEEGLQIARSRGLDMGTAGVVCVADMAATCLLSMDRLDVPAVVPAGVELPDEYDPLSGQLWTRDVLSWIPVDLLGRGFLAR
jgi:hypothetical protein